MKLTLLDEQKLKLYIRTINIAIYNKTYLCRNLSINIAVFYDDYICHIFIKEMEIAANCLIDLHVS